MAMVAIKLLLPSAQDIDRLRRLRHPLRLYKSRDLLNSRHAALFLRGDKDDNSVKVTVEYADVVFKFEIFNLVLGDSKSSLPVLGEMATLEGWDQVRCVIACQWLRPAIAQEVPSSLEKIVYQRGLRDEIPSTATAIGISMVGIVFHDAAQNSPIGMIFTDDSDPCSLLLSRNPDEIREFTSTCETVPLADFAEWWRDLEKWHTSLDAKFRELKPVR